MHFDPGDVDFRATATRFANIFVFLKFGVSQLLHAPSIQRREYKFVLQALSLYNVATIIPNRSMCILFWLSTGTQEHRLLGVTADSH